MKKQSLNTYALMLLAVVMLITAVLVGVVFQSLSRATDDGDVINAAGRQRMLSQAMAKSILGYNAAKANLENSKENVADLDSFITQMRGNYTKAVIGPAKESGVTISMNPLQESHAAVPFPATFTRLVNEKFAAGGGLSVDIISNNPINKQQTLKDTTDKEAYNFLLNNPKEMFTRSVEQNGNMYLRFYTADVAVVQGCADCHTGMTSGTFKAGDMLGIRRFSLLYSNDIAAGEARLNPSLVEYEQAAEIFSKTLAAFKSGGSYPVDLKMTKERHYAGVTDKAFKDKIGEIEREFAAFKSSVSSLDDAKPGSQAHWDAQQDILNGSNTLRKLSNDLTKMFGELAHANQANIQWAVAFLALIIVAAFAAIYLFLNKGILGPLNKILTRIEGMAEGDLTQRVELDRKDELGDLGRMVNMSMVDMGGSIVSIKTSAGHLHNLSNEMCDASRETGESVKRQASEIEQVAAAVNEMGTTVQEMAKNTSLAAESTDKARHAAENGQQVVSSTINSITALAGEVKEAAEVIRLVEEDSNNINSILEVIRGIAEQTNLLALNAAIEAARAGEHGRGFSVVADEVRSLASRTQESTGEIQAMIESLQRRTQEAVTTMDRGTDTAEKSVEEAANASNALQEIVDGVNVISEMNTQVATAAEELSNVTQEIDNNIVAVNDAARQTSDVADRSYEASHRVTVLAGEVGTLMNRFKVDLSNAGAVNSDRDALFVWNDNLDVGIDEVNRQHKVLIGIINELYDLIQTGRSGGAVRRVLQGLVDYTVNHFGYEEHLMEEFGYPDFDAHKAKHKALIAKVQSFVTRFDNNEDVGEELLEFLKEWLKNHILGSDKEYSPYLNSKGIR